MRSSLMTPVAGLGLAILLTAIVATAQQPANRIPEAIDSGSMTVLPGSVNARLAAGRDIGRLDAGTPIQSITLWFQPTAEQKAQLDALVQAQQTPGSPWYHMWLSPAQYASRFGLSDSDLARVQSWLESQGFNVGRVSNSHTNISFSGSAGQVESAFQTELHRYQIGAETHFANATELAIPSALSGVVSAVRNLDDFRPAPHFRPSPATLLPAFTSAQSGDHFLTPDDVATIYDINPAYSAGYTGAGLTIAVMGQSEISVSDIEAFQSAAGLTTKAPTVILVPGTGTAAVSSGDEAESDIDLEYSGGTARGAAIDLVYVGNNQNYNVFDSLQYAIDNRVAPILSISYGVCEPDLGSGNFTTLEGLMEQAASQGQTVVTSSGDSGSTACYAATTKTPVTSAMEVLAVNYPASSVYAVAAGGTEFPLADVASGNTTYWKSAGGSDIVNSALSYIPEQAWNDDTSSPYQSNPEFAVSSGGGGISTMAARPSWQTGVPGIPSGNFRLVPDISLSSSPDNAPYLFCSSDTSAWGSGQKASCNAGFRDSTTQDLTGAGGTSFAAPIFAGMLAIIEQKESSGGLGVANRTLYSLASNASTYASAFHDITSGNNECTAGSAYCSAAGASQYSAGAGYDEATGLGSVDFNNLMTAWSSSGTGGSGGGTGTGSFLLSAANVTVTHGNSATSAVGVVSQNGYAGTVGFTVTSASSTINTDGCYTIGNATVAAGATASSTLTIYTSSSACAALSGAHSFARHGTTGVTASTSSPLPGSTLPMEAAALAGVILFGFRKSRKAWALFSCLVLVATLGLAVGCGSSSGNATNLTSSTTNTDVAAGTYTLTVVGADTTTSSITTSTTLTLTVN